VDHRALHAGDPRHLDSHGCNGAAQRDPVHVPCPRVQRCRPLGQCAGCRGRPGDCAECGPQ
jgi:hypothetical protein